VFLVPAACGGGDPVDPGGNGGNGGNGNGGGAPAVTGSVTFSGSGVGSVQLVLRNGPAPDRQLTTENDGDFTFSNVAEGAWELVVTPPGYFELAAGQAEVRNVQVPAQGNVTVNVTLEPVAPMPVQEIQALATSFASSNLTVSPGTRIRWRNAVDDFHTITPSGHTEWARGTVTGTGATFEAVVNNPGSFNYYCEPHQGLGMVGVIQVTSSP
jgi:plastocyanin